MNYFVNEKQRKASQSSCYFEFQKGYYHDVCWLDDSISISDDFWCDYRLSDLFGRVIKDFNYYGITIVTKEHWKEIVALSREVGSPWKEVIEEAIPWVNSCFEANEVFSILGI